MNSCESIPNWLMKRAFLTPDRIALKCKEQVLTFKELHLAASSTAKRLAHLGIKNGDTVAILMNNSIEMAVLIHALKYLGAITVLLNIRLTGNELRYQLEDSHTAYLITNGKFEDKVQELNTSIASLKIIFCEKLESAPEAEVAFVQEFQLTNVDTVMYTSGTTGKPKGVMQTYGNHWWSAIASVLNLGFHEHDSWLAAVPFFHISGLSILMRSVIYGIPVIIQEQFDPVEANEEILKGNVTIMSVVTAMLQRMLEALGDKKYPASFRCMLLGGGPAPKPVLTACRERGIPVYQTYGMTETASQVVTLSPEYSLSKLGSAGKPLFPAQLRIVTEGREAKANEPGEIVVKGPLVTIGYLNRPEDTKHAIRDGWFYTGDIGYLDEEGFLYVLDRRSDLIISGGENIYPAEIEAVLLSHDAVKEAGVIGISDEAWGKVPCAFVKIDPEKQVTQEELIAFCKERLASYKVPKKIYFVKELPKNAANKLLRRELRRLID